MKTKRAAITKMVIGMGIVITLTACGGSGDDSNNNANAGATPTPTPTVAPQNPNPTATPTPSVTPSPTVSPTSTPAVSPTPTASPTASPTPPQPTATPEPAAVSFVEFANVPICTEQANSGNNVCQQPAPDSFNIIERYPLPFSNRMPVHETITIQFGQEVSQAESELVNFISLKESDTGINIAGKATHSNDNSILFTPDDSLKFSTKYTLTIANGLISKMGESFAGNEWQFATLFDVGVTKREVINRCGLGKDLLYLGWVNHTRRLEAGSACAQFGFTAQPAMSFSCSLRAASARAAFTKSRTLTPAGGFDANFNYQSALDEFKYSAEKFDTHSAVGANSLSQISELFVNGFSSTQCEVMMNADFTELGGGGGEISRFAPNSYFFHEIILAKPTP